MKFNLPFDRRLKQGSWIRKSDWKLWFDILVWSLTLEGSRELLLILYKRIKKMYDSQSKRRNLRFVYTYLKESYTLTLSVLAGNQYVPKIRVRIGKSGLPLIIPGRLRASLLKREQPMHTAVLTMLAIHRIVPWWPRVDVSTVVAPFSGISEVISSDILIRACKQLCVVSGVKYKSSGIIRCPRIKHLELRSASPNSKVSVEGIIWDAFAFYYNPGYLFKLSLLYLRFNGLLYFMSLLLILVFGWPLFLRAYSKRGGEPFHLGKIGVVYNVAGKSRIIGITNYWIQLAMYPLHKGIFRFLEKLPSDGTFDQLRPIDRLKEGQEYRSYDLTAATDRIPLAVQRQILELFTDKWTAYLWSELIRFPMRFVNKRIYNIEGEMPRYINYAVGQPMGCYSSWAMLALTHHIIVQASSKEPIDNYAVLGDDVVVPGEIGDTYLATMTSLGVSISLAKSIISSEFVEFAKRVKTLTGHDYSVLGPGLILSAVRNRFLASMVVAEAFAKQLINRYEAPRKLSSAPGRLTPELLNFGINVLVGVNGLLSKAPGFAPKGGETGSFPDIRYQSLSQRMINYRNLFEILVERHAKSQRQVREILDKSLVNIWRMTSGNLFLRSLHSLLLVLSPYMGVILSKGEALEVPPPTESNDNYMTSIPDLYNRLEEIRINCLEPLDRRRATDMLSMYRKLCKNQELRKPNVPTVQLIINKLTLWLEDRIADGSPIFFYSFPLTSKVENRIRVFFPRRVGSIPIGNPSDPRLVPGRPRYRAKPKSTRTLKTTVR